MFEFLKGKKVLVTGGCGTVGHALAKEFTEQSIEFASLSRNEAAQFKLKQSWPSVSTYIGDIKDIGSLRRAFIKFKPQVVIHAAAVKVVPVAEREMLNTFETNALGTYNVAKVCEEFGVEAALMIGTDKQCSPVNVYGMTKHIGTSIFSDSNRNGKTRFVSTRYGNVLCSRSSLGVILMDQVKKKNDLTVTDPNMTRFFFTIQEGIRLIEIALKHAYDTLDYDYYGETFSTMMCAARLGDLFDALSVAYGCKVIEIGRRPGEKTHEDLMASYELDDTIIWTKEPYSPFYAPEHTLFPYVTIPHLAESPYRTEQGFIHKPTQVFSSENAPRLNQGQIMKMLEFAYNNTFKD